MGLLAGGKKLEELNMFWDMVNLLKEAYYTGSEMISLQGATNQYKYEQATSSLLQTLWNIRRFFNNALEIDIDRECGADVLP